MSQLSTPIPSQAVAQLKQEFQRVSGYMSHLQQTMDEILDRINDDQRWFWTDECQQGLREAEADIAAGRVNRFESVEALAKHLGIK